MPASTSSKTRVADPGVATRRPRRSRPRLSVPAGPASTRRTASMVRASSPPEATLARGRTRLAGVGAEQPGDVVARRPVGPPRPRSGPWAWPARAGPISTVADSDRRGGPAGRAEPRLLGFGQRASAAGRCSASSAAARSSCASSSATCVPGPRSRKVDHLGEGVAVLPAQLARAPDGGRRPRPAGPGRPRRSRRACGPRGHVRQLQLARPSSRSCRSPRGGPPGQAGHQRAERGRRSRRPPVEVRATTGGRRRAAPTRRPDAPPPLGARRPRSGSSSRAASSSLSW